jgi:hypothetical protein
VYVYVQSTNGSCDFCSAKWKHRKCFGYNNLDYKIRSNDSTAERNFPKYFLTMLFRKCSLSYSMTLSVSRVCTAVGRVNGWMKNSERCGRKRSWPNWNTIPPFVSRNWGKSQQQKFSPRLSTSKVQGCADSSRSSYSAVHRICQQMSHYVRYRNCFNGRNLALWNHTPLH